MKGLYLNVPDARTRAIHSDHLLGAPTALTVATHHQDEIVVNYHPLDWPAGPILRDPEHDLTLAGSGWFLLRGKPGNLRELADGFLKASDAESRRALFAEITAGAFVILILQGNERWVVTDPFGLHPHYHPAERPLSALAPAPSFLAPPIVDGRADEVLADALDRQGHLFGNYTAYRGIQRLHPGRLQARDASESYFDYAPAAGSASLDEETGIVLIARLREVVQAFGGRARILPLSGGLDSRLLLALGEMDYGYTFGPEDTGDRPIARPFAGHFKDYDEFSFLDLEYPRELRQGGRPLFDGVCARPFLELLPVYRRLVRRWGGGSLFLDGYGGDVLQRGIYLTWGGVSGSLAKLVPRLGRMRFDPHRLLDRRYAALAGPARRLLHESFERESESWHLNAFRKATLFELLYGRGSRYILNGGTILSGQYFTPVQPFFVPAAFRLLWAIDPTDAASYRALRRIWRGLPRELSRLRTYSGFKPMWPHDVARTAMLVTKGLGKAGIWKRAVGYEKELPHIRWQEDRPIMAEAASAPPPRGPDRPRG
ncbi:MAG: hypothetical protein V1774_10480 [Candidatus Eisenbacteria bacterium]